MDNEHKFFYCKICSVRVPRNILTKVFIEENVHFFISFVFWAKFSSFLSEYFEQDCWNWNLRVDKKFLKKIKFFEKDVGVFVFFSEMSEKLSTFWQKPSGRVVENAFDVCIGSVWEVLCEKKSDTFILLAHWTKFFRHSVEDFPAEMSEKASKFLIIFWHWAQTFRLLSGKLPTGLPKLNSVCLQEQIERLIFLEKTSEVTFILFGHWAKNFWLFINFFRIRMSKVYSTCQ